MRVKNALLRLVVNVKNAALALLRKSKYWSLMEETLRWSFRRLPPDFTAPLIAITAFYFVLLYPVLVYQFVPWLLQLPARGAHELFNFGSVSQMGRLGKVAAKGYR